MYRAIAALTLIHFCSGCTVMTPRSQAEQWATTTSGMQVIPITSESWFGDGRLLLKVGDYSVKEANTEWGSTEIGGSEANFRFVDDRWVDLVLGLKKRAPAILQEQTKLDGFSLSVATPSKLWNVTCKHGEKIALVRWYENDPITEASKAATTDCLLQDAQGEIYRLNLSYDNAGFRNGAFVSKSASYPIFERNTVQMQSPDKRQVHEVKKPYSTEYQLQDHGESILRLGLMGRDRALALSNVLSAEHQESFVVAAIALTALDILWRFHMERDTPLQL